MRKLMMVLMIGCLLVGWVFAGQPAKTSDFFPVSVWYSGGKARAPMLSEITSSSRQEWLRDLQQIKSLGFNTVRTWVEWAHCEPEPGVYRFENLRLLCELAREVGLRVIVQMYVDSAPDWVAKKFPDALFEAQSGDKVKPQAAPGCCTDHEGVQKAVMNFYTETAKIAASYDHFFAWDLWSEPHIVNWAYINYVPNVQFCYCPHTQAAFRRWLQKKYQTLAALNKAWYRNFADWSEVEAPRFGTILSYTDFIDWKNFIYEKLAQDLRWRYEAIRKGDPVHVITSHAAVPSIFYSPYVGYGATDDFLMAEQVDYYGTSLYPKHNRPSTHWELWRFQAAEDFSRSANRKNGGFYVGELQAGKGTYGLNIGNPITPEDHRLWMWSTVAKGARAINIYAYYPMSSGYESGGYGLINLDGSVTERAIAAGKTAQIITKYQDVFLRSRPVPAQVAIVYNPLAQMVGGEQRTVTTDMNQQSLLGYYRFFTKENIPVDFIHRRDLESGELSQYKLIIVPYPLMFTEAAAAGLRKFISAGGRVVAEARLAWNDERGYAASAIPGMGLDAVFGVRETSVKMAEEVAMRIVETAHPAMKRLTVNDTLWGANFAESIETLQGGGRILARLEDGSPCLAAAAYGKGETLFIGSFLGMASHLTPKKTNAEFLRGVVDWARIERRYSSSHDGREDAAVEIRAQENPQGWILFLINHEEKPQQLQVSVKTDRDKNYRLLDIVHDQTLQVISRNKELVFTPNIAGRDVQVWVIE